MLNFRTELIRGYTASHLLSNGEVYLYDESRAIDSVYSDIQQGYNGLVERVDFASSKRRNSSDLLSIRR